jgi:hypothetical protein
VQQQQLGGGDSPAATASAARFHVTPVPAAVLSRYRPHASTPPESSLRQRTQSGGLSKYQLHLDAVVIGGCFTSLPPCIPASLRPSSGASPVIPFPVQRSPWLLECGVAVCACDRFYHACRVLCHLCAAPAGVDGAPSPALTSSLPRAAAPSPSPSLPHVPAASPPQSGRGATPRTSVTGPSSAAGMFSPTNLPRGVNLTTPTRPRGVEEPDGSGSGRRDASRPATPSSRRGSGTPVPSGAPVPRASNASKLRREAVLASSSPQLTHVRRRDVSRRGVVTLSRLHS